MYSVSVVCTFVCGEVCVFLSMHACVCMVWCECGVFVVYVVRGIYGVIGNVYVLCV